MNILLVTGSLRERSYNTFLMRSVSEMKFENVDFQISNSVADLPFFNQDLDREDKTPRSVLAWRKQIELSEGIIFFTPEYAHSISGSLKNAIEWLISSFEIIKKPCIVISSSPNHLGAAKANSMLQNLLEVISTKIYKNLSISFNSINKKFNNEGLLINSETELVLKQAVRNFVDKIISEVD